MTWVDFWAPGAPMPEWKDAGRRVEAEYEDGSAVIGNLAADEFFDGVNEYPVFTIEDDASAVHPFVCKRWRYLDDTIPDEPA
jgi:hypothetical protein